MLLDGGEGSRILVTTRNEKCSLVMGAQKPYILRGLSEESSWRLFEQKAFVKDAEKRPELVKIGKKIVRQCQGLPLAIQLMGCAMHRKSKESEWQAVLENETWKLQHTKNEILPGLWLSYADLPTHLKKCFAFCAMIPKDHDIEEWKLIQFWIAHGFIPSENGNDMEVEGQEIFTELIRRSLLQSDCPLLYASENRRVCKMHDLIHDLARFVLQNECFALLKSSAATKIPTKPRHLNLRVDKSNQDDCSIIRTVLFCRRDYSVLTKLKFVRVLDLSEAHIDELPASIELLQHLRYLDISYTDIRKLPESICMLVNLQTLNLYCCYKLSELPKSITYMNNLRHLLFDNGRQFEAFPAGLSQLQNLKTLPGYTVGDDQGNNIGQLKSLNLFGELALYNLQKVENAADAREANLGNKKNIHTLKLSWGKLSWGSDDECCLMENAEKVLEALKPHNGVEKLIVSYYSGKQFPMWMRERQQFQYLHCIKLFKCKACQQLPPLEILPCLEDLSIREMDGIKHIVNIRGGNALQTFHALKFLELKHMKNLEGWCVQEGSEANLSLFPCLIWMSIEGCHKLTTMPPGIFPCLKHLRMCEMDGIKHIVSNRRGRAPQSFPALEKLWLEKIRNLEAWCSVEEGREANPSLFPSLIWMDIRYCPKLTATMPPMPTLQELYMEQSFCETQISLMPTERSFFKHLESLRILKIHSCTEELVLLLQDEEETRAMKSSLEHLSIRNCNQLSLTLILQNLTSLRDLRVNSIENLVSSPYEMQGWNSLNHLMIISCKNYTGASSQGDCGPPFLKHLDIFECDALRALPMCPKSLQELVIHNCAGIQSLWPEMGHLTSLSKLAVYQCPKLVSLSDEMQSLTSLESLSIENCPLLKSFPEGLQQLLPALKFLIIKGCPELERLCKPGGDYYNLLSTILYKQIGGALPKEITIQVPHEISTDAEQAFKCIATNRFLLSAIFICAIAFFINFLFNQLHCQNEKEFWYIPPT